MTKLGAALAAVFCLCAGTAWAQTTPLVIDQQRTDRRPPSVSQPGHAPVRSGPSVTLAQKVTPFVLRAVQISGSSLSPDTLSEAARPYIGQTVDAAAIKTIENAMSDAYAKSNIALYTIEIPDQDFANGVLRVDVVEGYVENVDLEGDVSGDLDLIKAYAAKLAVEKPVTRATFQRYVSLIRDIPGLTADIKLVQGTARGAVRMIVTLHQKKWQLDMSLNTGGSAELGRVQVEADGTAYGLFREGEQTTLTLALPTTPSRFQYIAFSDSEPVDDDGTIAKLGAGYLHTRPRFSMIDGNAELLQLLVSHPLIRSYDENLVLTASMDGINSADAQLGQTLANERVRALRGAVAYSKTYTTDSFVLSATLSQGLDILGARVESPLIATPDFTKLNAQAAFNQVLWKDWVIRLRATGQYAFARLPASELFALGGPDFGRAFPAATLTGDQAAAGSAEFAWHPQKFPFLAPDGTELYAFIDGGKIWALRRGAIPGQGFDLASVGGGVRVPFNENSSVEIELARQLDAPAALYPRKGWEVNFAIKQRL